MKPSKGVKIDPALKKAVSQLLKDTMASSTATHTDKCRVIDRALKLAAIEAKFEDGQGFGAGFGKSTEEGE